MATGNSTKVVSFDPSKIPTAPTTPPKYDRELLGQYVGLMESGRAAGDGVLYTSAKEARSAANSIKRAIRKTTEGFSTRTRIWSPDGGKAFQFALLRNDQPITGNAARQAADEA